MRQTFEIPLDIPDVTIEHVTANRRGHLELTVKSTIEGPPCHPCGTITTKVYGEERAITLRHWPIVGRTTFIRLRPRRYQCTTCPGHPTTPPHLSWDTPRSSSTRAYEAQILLSLVNSTGQDVSIKDEGGYEAIMGISDRHMEQRVEWDSFTCLEVVGLDERSLKKGHRHFVASVTGRIENETVIGGVLPERQKVTVKAFLSGRPQRLRRTIRTVWADRYDGFVQAVKEVCGQRVKIVIDRFHGAKRYRNGLDRLRKQELRRLKQELLEEE